MASTAAEKENAAQEFLSPPAIDGHPAKAEVVGLSETTAAKEKRSKSKVPNENKFIPRAASVHPPYFEMIKEAISVLKERTGSSRRAIAKYMEEMHKSHLPPNYKKILAVQIKKLVLAGKLIKVKASFKLAAAESKGKKGEGSEKKKTTTGVKKTAEPVAKISSNPKVAITSAKSTKPKIAKSAGVKPSSVKPAKVAKSAATAKKTAGIEKGAPANKPTAGAAAKTKPVKVKKPKSIKSSGAVKAKVNAPPASPAAKKPEMEAN